MEVEEIKKKQPRDSTLEGFLKENHLTLEIEEDPTPLAKEQRFWVNVRPFMFLALDHSGGGREMTPSGFGEGADIAIRNFMKTIAGRRFNLDESSGYRFIPKELEWDGILRVAVKSRSKSKRK